MTSIYVVEIPDKREYNGEYGKFSNSKKKEGTMKNYATCFLANYIEKSKISAEDISNQLEIPVKKIIPGTRESLTGEECLRLCQYLHIRPEDIMKNMEIK